ncbi:GNAT family N-acetyltransferase ['Paenibacillus yunnanensis' Narsing Rao et al. 2020]|uniref:GNAT family N-acetyltransferase n=1 Tax=Paenibacillus tengchongensis TaxID=2608684 RepID=UPI00124D6AE9|nr:GNAT family N-acetyltransferase [Paenibacillus tengchongensis]
MTMTIKKCTLEDLKLLQEISYVTFEETFKDQNSEETMAAYLEQAFSLDKLEQELNKPSSEFYLLMTDNEVAGYMKLNTGAAQSEAMGEASLEIERIYIRQSFHKQGLGRLLIDKAAELAKQQSKTKVWLGVWEHNGNAIAFYSRMGFVQTGTHPFVIGDEVQTDYIMTKTLTNL